MGAFQIVYDDFTGGQYMGPRDTNQPKNTWIGDGVLVNPKGELIPTGAIHATSYTGPSNSDFTVIVNHFILASEARVQPNAFAFVKFATSSPYTVLESVIIKYPTGNGTAFPVTPTVTTITGGELEDGGGTFRPDTGLFYYIKKTTTAREIWSYNPSTNAQTLVSSLALATNIQHVDSYKYRLVAYGPFSNRLLYSLPDLTTWNSATQYYEFSSPITRVYARSDDLLVVTFDGTYSMTGVLGASVNIQQIIPTPNMSEGMRRGAVVGRSLYFVDDLFSGPSDGRIHRLIGATVQEAGVFQASDYGFNSSGEYIVDEISAANLIAGKLGFAFRRGMTYLQTTPSAYARVRATTNTNFAVDIAGQQKIAEPVYLAPNEYTCVGFVNYDGGVGTFNAYRVLTNITEPTKLDYSFTSSNSRIPIGTPSINATGTVELPEYWHQKPFTVKEAFIEYKNLAGASISVKVEPTGVVNTTATNVGLSESTTITQTDANASDWVMYRYHPNNAAKGFGAKPILTLTNTSVKRVILNCED